MLSLAPSGIASAAAPVQRQDGVQTGYATYYGKAFDGKKTASGERHDKNALVAAHPRYPLGTVLQVTNLRNGRSVTVRINDRGPAKSARDKGVIVDLSDAAAVALGLKHRGKVRVRTQVVEWGT